MRNIVNISENGICGHFKAKLQFCTVFKRLFKKNPSSASNKKRSCFRKVSHLLLAALLFAITNYAFAERCTEPKLSPFEEINDRRDRCRTNPPSPPNPPRSEPPVIPSVSGIDIFIDISGDFDKPVIIVEGYDPVNMVSARDLSHLIPNDLRDDLKLNGRDIVAVSFTDGAKSLRDNSIKLQNFIRQVNENKSGNYPNAIIGISAGGVISRHALKSMENLNAHHDTSLYISIDAPHRGAFIPKDLTSALIHMNKKAKKYGRLGRIFKFLTFGVLGGTDGVDLSAFIKFSDSDAAKELLVVNPQSSVFFEELDSLGYPDDLVRIAYAIGDSNGSRTGISDNPSNTLLRYRIKPFSGKRWHYRITVGDCFYPCDPLNGHYASSAGSTSNAIEVLHDALEDIGNSKAPIYEKNLNPVGFIPTFSALDFKHWDLDTPYTEDIKNYSPFDYIYVAGGNGAHDGGGIARIIHENMGNIMADINNYHVPSPQIPSRNEKITPLESISGRLDAEVINTRRGATEYYLNWNTVEGATHYEIFYNNSLIKTVNNQFASISINSRTNVQVRSCNENTCTYPVARILVHHRHGDGLEIEK